MNPSRVMRNTVSVSLVVFLAACAASGPRLEAGRASGDNWKRDFRMTAGLDHLSRSGTYEDKVQSLDELLAQEMAKNPMCPNGYDVTRHGTTGVRYWWVEGVCA